MGAALKAPPRLYCMQGYCHNLRTFDVVLPGVSPPFSGLPSGDVSEVLRFSSVESIIEASCPPLVCRSEVS